VTDALLPPRERILVAVVELAARGGYDAVQVRELAELANVSTKTIYNNFGSLENVLAEAMVQWRRQVTEASVVTVKGRTLEERVLSLYRHGFDAFSRQPRLFEAFQRTWVQTTHAGLDWGSTSVHDAIEAELAAFDTEFADDFRMILADVTYAVLRQVGCGQQSPDEAWARIDRTVRRLARSAPPRQPGKRQRRPEAKAAR
jgi:TetR/AcrR family transcriptional regulator, cholesterol catabolism regulator